MAAATPGLPVTRAMEGVVIFADGTD